MTTKSQRANCFKIQDTFSRQPIKKFLLLWLHMLLLLLLMNLVLLLVATAGVGQALDLEAAGRLDEGAQVVLQHINLSSAKGINKVTPISNFKDLFRSTFHSGKAKRPLDDFLQSVMHVHITNYLFPVGRSIALQYLGHD